MQFLPRIGSGTRRAGGPATVARGGARQARHVPDGSGFCGTPGVDANGEDAAAGPSFGRPHGPEAGAGSDGQARARRRPGIARRAVPGRIALDRSGESCEQPRHVEVHTHIPLGHGTEALARFLVLNRLRRLRRPLPCCRSAPPAIPGGQASSKVSDMPKLQERAFALSIRRPAPWRRRTRSAEGRPCLRSARGPSVSGRCSGRDAAEDALVREIRDWPGRRPCETLSRGLTGIRTRRRTGARGTLAGGAAADAVRQGPARGCAAAMPEE